MSSWLLAGLVGIGFALLGYAGRTLGPRGPRLLSAGLRALAAATITAILLNAPMAPPQQRPVLVALDASASWRRGGDTTAWRRARAAADSLGSVTVLVGQNGPESAVPDIPDGTRSSIGPLVDRAVADGRSVALVTDGELDDAASLSRLPERSTVRVVRPVPRADAALVAMDAPSLVVAGDSADIAVTLVGGEVGAGAGTIAVRLDDLTLGERPLAPLAPYEERTIALRVATPATAALRVLRARLVSAGDAEARNDTLARTFESTARPSAVFVATVPDADSRWIEAAVRGSLGAPTRAYYRVTKQSWRDGALAPVDESVVRRAVAESPLVVLDGDTAYFGEPRRVSRGGLLLVAPPATSDGEWYASGAGASPLATALGQLALDSLPPLDVVDAPRGAWTALEAKRSRQGDARRAVTGSDSGRRVVHVSAAGFARWKQRGGRASEAFDAVFGAVVAWLAEASPDARAAVPMAVVLREGDPVRWQRGGPDSLVVVQWMRRGAGTRGVDTLHFRGSGLETTTRPMDAGVYDIVVRGGAALLVVNVSNEWVPRRPSVATGAVGTANAARFVPRARDARWLYAMAIVLLCVEWLLRRRIGLR